MKTILLSTLFLELTAMLNMSVCPDLENIQTHASLDSVQIKSQNVRIVFWNVENLYDPYDDTTTLDDEFTREGAKRWSFTKFRSKLLYLSKTLIAIGRWDPPAIVGLCEIENRYVLNKLLYETPLKQYKYRIAHHDSPDLRGVDVAILYRPTVFQVLGFRSIPIRFPFDTLSQTREILAVKGLVFNVDTLHLFVNHWPSRRGGEEASRPRRCYVAGILRAQIDSILAVNHLASVVIMGDFNDEPFDESLRLKLGAGDPLEPDTSRLVNLMMPRTGKEGTHKFQGHWGLLDQFIVSTVLLQPESPLQTSPRQVEIFSGPFLLEEDVRYFGKKPSRTYAGPRYLGGFSDHLPVSLILTKQR